MNDSMIAQPNENDVILNGDKGSQYLNHRGNVNHRNLIHDNLCNHKNLPRAEKHTVCRKVYDCIVQGGGRFIQIVNTDHRHFIHKSWNDVEQQIKMCFRNTGKLHPKIYKGELSLPPSPHADLSTILSLLFKNLPSERLQSFLADPTIVNNIAQRLNSLAAHLEVHQTFHFQSLHQLSSANNPSHGQSKIPKNNQPCLPNETVEHDEAILLNEKIEAIHRAYQECPSSIPTTQTLLPPSKPTLQSNTKKLSRNFFFDSGIMDSSSWPELLSRQIKGDHVKQTVSIYAFDALGINKILSVKSVNNNNKLSKPHNNSTTRAFKCSSCPKDLTQGWSVQVRLIPNTDNLWAVVPFNGGKNALTWDIPCKCHPTKKGTVSDHLFLNSRLSRNFVSKNHWKSSGHIDNSLSLLFRGERGVMPKKLPAKSHRKVAIDFLLDCELDKLRHRCLLRNHRWHC